MKCNITVIVTAYQRIPETLVTVAKLQNCVPAPDEILIHTDFGGDECRAAIAISFPHIRILSSDTPAGPGGARNKLIAAAKNEIVASFDDDSYPVDTDYFARVLALATQFPEAAVLNAAVYHRNETIESDERSEVVTADFIGCGCVYRRSAFLATTGYVPLPVAYGMEEVDLALRLHAQRQWILSSRWLRVFHDTDLARHADARVTAASIANLALLAFLRYPISFWPVGLGQVLNRVVWLIRHGRYAGLLQGLFVIPRHCYRYRRFRAVLSGTTVCSYIALRRNPRPVHLACV